MKDILTEAVIVGIVTAIIGKILSQILININKLDENKEFPIWKEPKIIFISLFLTGIFIHLFCECIGLNKWYCDKKTRKCFRKIALLGIKKQITLE